MGSESTTINAAHVLSMDETQSTFTPGYVTVQGSTIVDVGEGQITGPNSIDRTSHILMPGLVNAHTHTPMSLMRGVAEGHSLLTMEGWHDTIRVLEEKMTPSMIAPAVSVSLEEMLSSGTTAFGDQYFFMSDAVPTIAASGMRAVLSYGIVQADPDEPPHDELDAARTFLEGGRDDPSTIRRWIGPHAFFVDNTTDTICAEVELAIEFNAGLHAHFSTDGEEDRYTRQRYGISALAKLAELGALDQPMLLAHCLVVDPEDLALVARNDTTFVLAASVCMTSGAPAAPMRAMLDAGVNVAIGTDNVCNNNSYDMFEEMRTLSRLMSFREQRPSAVSSREILTAATRSGARGLGLNSGTLEAGRAADLVALDMRRLRRGPTGAQSVESMVLFGGSPDCVTDVMVNGSWLRIDQEFTGASMGGPKEQFLVDEAYKQIAAPARPVSV